MCNKADDRQIAGQADCGCTHHAEDGIPCPHDIALALVDFPESETPDCPECPDGGRVGPSAIGQDWYCYECCCTF